MIERVMGVDFLQHGFSMESIVAAAPVLLAEESTNLGWLAIEICAGAGGILTIVASLPKLRHSTLTGPMIWACISLASLLAAECLVTFATLASPAEQACHYLAAITVFCPFISLLGSRRPHALAWNFVVLTLFGVLAMPALELVVVGRARELDMEDARGWFLGLLLILSTANYLPTRHWLAGVLLGIGQFCFLAKYLPLVGQSPLADTFTDSTAACGLLFLSAAILTVRIRHRRATSESNVTDAWLEFRDSFGGLWALRIGEQLNAAARLNHWPFTVRWHGVQQDGENTGDEAAFQQAMRNVLRRFLSPDRLDETFRKP